MHITPEPYDAALVAVAVEALRHFGDEIDRATARTLLAMWRFRAALSEQEVAAVLRNFPTR